MEKAGEEFFMSINDVAKKLDLPAHTLRYWEKQFSGDIRPITGLGGRRYYRPETVEKLSKIKSLLYDKGFTIAGVKKLLHNGDFTSEISDIKQPETTVINHQNQQLDIQDMFDIDEAIDILKQAYEVLE